MARATAHEVEPDEKAEQLEVEQIDQGTLAILNNQIRRPGR